MNTEKQYNKFSKRYSDNRGKQDKICDNDFYQMLNKNIAGASVLDVGCGNGDDLLHIKHLGAREYGIEPSEEFVNDALSKGLNVQIGSGERLPFPANKFDYVISKYAIQTSPNVAKILQESARVLKVNGILHILVKHPLRQFLEKKKFQQKPVNYFNQEITESIIYDGLISLREPTHSMEDYLNAAFFNNFEIIDYRENFDFPASEQINGDIYPTYFVLTARKKDHD